MPAEENELKTKRPKVDSNDSPLGTSARNIMAEQVVDAWVWSKDTMYFIHCCFPKEAELKWYLFQASANLRLKL